MKNLIKKAILIFALSLMCVLMCGCMATSAEELYSLPESSERYMQIQNKVNELLSGGFAYAAPISGYNRQAIQLHDIDGDGTEEAVVFFRTDEDGKKPLAIYVLKDIGESFEAVSVIEGDGANVDSVAYIDMNGDGVLEMAVGWQMTSSVKTISVYSVKDYQPVSLISSAYANYTYSDMDGDGDSEILLLHTGTTEAAGDVTMYMLMDDGEIVSSTAYLSLSAERTARILSGLLSDRTNAVFIDSVSGDGVITDVVTLKDGSLTNITLDMETNNSSTFRAYTIYCGDMNNDGIVEVPEPYNLLAQSETVYYAINWNAYSVKSAVKTAITTYHNYSDGWYIILPDTLVENITIRREDRVSGERVVVFSVITDKKDEEGNPVLRDILEIYSLTGDNREDRAKISGRFITAREDEQIFAAQILSGGEEYMDREYVHGNFRLIHTTWLTGVV